MKAILRKARISPKKANLVAGIVRMKPVEEALELLQAMPKKGARMLYDVIHSAASNAKNNFHQSMSDLVITRILVTKGPTYKRSLPVSRGRAHPILKRTAHITVEVGVLGAKTPKPSKKTAKEVVETEGEDTEKAEKKSVKKVAKKPASAKGGKAAPAKKAKKA